MRRELVATISGRDQESQLVVERRSGRHWTVSLDGETFEVDAVEIRPGTWSLIMGTRSILVDLDTRGAEPARATTVAGERISLTVMDAQRYKLAKQVGAGPAAGATGEIVRAPIAGKVIKVLVAAGDDVAVGQGVAVLEAMKMENEIRAERGGTVTEIHAEAGQPIDTGQKLITLS